MLSHLKKGPKRAWVIGVFPYLHICSDLWRCGSGCSLHFSSLRLCLNWQVWDTICFHYFLSLPLWISDHSWSSRQPWWEASRGNENASSVDAWRRPTASRKAEQVWSSEKLDDEELRRQAKWKSQEVKNVGTSSEVGPFLSISKHWLIFIHFSAPNWEPSVGRSFSDSLEEAVQAYMAQHDADLVREGCQKNGGKSLVFYHTCGWRGGGGH